MLRHWLLLLAVAWSHQAENQVDQTNLPVVISIGGSLEPLEDTSLYTVQEMLTFIIPDVPDTMKPISRTKCPEFTSDPYCQFITRLNSLNQESFKLLRVVNKILTVRGLNSTTKKTIQYDPNEFDPAEVEESDADPSVPVEAKALAGNNWFDELNRKLWENRRITWTNKNGSLKDIHRMRRALLPLMKFIPAIAPTLIKTARNGLFVPGNRILNLLSIARSLQPNQLRAFSEITPSVSELFSKARDMVGEILTTRKIIQKGPESGCVFPCLTPAPFTPDTLLQLQESIADISVLMFSTILYNIHTQILTDCRNNEVPISVVPPLMLKRRLIQLEKIIKEEFDLVIPPSDVMKFYTLKSSKCLLDNDGGIVQIPVPLKPAGAKFKLYKFQSLSFAWGNQTCSINVPGTYIVKDFEGQKIYPITSLDEENCTPNRNMMCQVPEETSDGISNLCLKNMILGGTVEELRKSCQMTCTKSTKYVISQISDDTFVVAHLSHGKSSVECGNNQNLLNSQIKYGALRIRLGCSCRLINDGKVIAVPTSTLCALNSTFKIEHLIPAHGTTFDDFIPNPENPTEIVFSHATEVLDENYRMVEDGSEDWGVEELQIITWVWNFCHSVSIAYILWRIHLSPAMLAALFPRAEARADGHYCKLPQDIYTMLTLILVFSLLGFLPALAVKVFELMQRVYWRTLNVIAERQMS